MGQHRYLSIDYDTWGVAVSTESWASGFVGCNGLVLGVVGCGVFGGDITDELESAGDDLLS